MAFAFVSPPGYRDPDFADPCRVGVEEIMRSSELVRVSLPALALVPLALVGACDLLGIPQELEIPIPLDTPPVEIDVGGAVGTAISQACSEPTAASCEGIALICQADNGGTPCDPVDLPAQFPKECPNLDGDMVSADSLLPPEVKEAAEVKFAIPVDLAEMLSAQGVDSSEQVKQISFNKIDLAWDENSLTFDAPVLDVYVGPAADDVTDPAALISDPAFTKVGTVGKDLDDDGAFDVGQAAGVADTVPLNFVSGGNDTFNEALRTFTFTLVLAAPEGQAVGLKDVEGSSEPVKVARPDGVATVRLKSELSFKVNLVEALQAGQ
jgi:hypothetical protein